MITIETKDLLRGIQTASLALGRRNTVPVLGGLRIKPEDSGIRLSGTDVDLQVDATIAADLNGSAFEAVITGAKMLSSVAKQSAAAQVGIEQTGDAGKVTARCGRFDFTCGTLPTEDWPDMDVPRRELMSAMLGADFIDALRRVKPSISDEETRYYLNGVNVQASSDGQGLTLVSTDGHKLTKISVAMADPSGDVGSIIIPRKTVDIVLAVAKDRPDEPVRFSVSTKIPKNSEEPNAAKLSGGDKHYCEFAIGNVRIISKLIDGTFPDYAKVIPASAPIRATFARADLIQAIKALHFSPHRKYGKSIKFDLGAGTAVASAVRADEDVSGKADLTFDGDAAGCVFGINAKYFADILSAHPAVEQITLAFTAVGEAPSYPITITAPGDDKALSLIMPMRV